MDFRIALYCLIALCSSHGVKSAVFTVENNCRFTIWPAILTGRGGAVLSGFELAPRAAQSVAVAPPWSGRVWGRYNCKNNGTFVCDSGDCVTGKIPCDTAGGIPPVTLVEFTLAGADNKDFFDVSLVDGFNLPVAVAPSRRSCPPTSCPADVNSGCPAEFAVRGGDGNVVGCKSACVALNQPEYCCSGEFSTPEKCPPTKYSMMFKRQCPQAYSYAYDDATSTFTCPNGGDYRITFCPN
ncbi:thaumatin-like protein 1b [Andrographis paniculata]|uniref:thaumatin-like protein 1b n=1 Tax=Andrographis paniculata TaxID=175694 RepID=UPI0021E79A9E|nr:thaumatin-like protein 1b [Andrographis paniculata]